MDEVLKTAGTVMKFLAIEVIPFAGAVAKIFTKDKKKKRKTTKKNK